MIIGYVEGLMGVAGVILMMLLFHFGWKIFLIGLVAIIIIPILPLKTGFLYEI